MTIAVQALRGGVASDWRPRDAQWQMNVSRTKRPAGSIQSGVPLAAAGALVLGALLATGMPVARGQDAVSGAVPAASPGANPGSQCAAAPGDTSGESSTPGARGAPTGTQTGPATQTTPGQPRDSAKSSKPQPVCFPLTGRCVEGAKASAAKGGAHSASKDGSSAQRPLNLAAPDVRTVVSADELKEPLPSSEQIAEVQEADTVSVKSEGVPTDVPGGFGAIWWALNHPSQAWKIVIPY